MIDSEESNHILNVMRHDKDDEIYITNGNGKIFKCRILLLKKKYIQAKILEEYQYHKEHPHVTLCIPKLRSIERFEFAIEKSTELGITNFIFFQAERAVSKNFNQKRIEKILISSIKQSLLSWLPEVKYVQSLAEIERLKGEKILFYQNAPKFFDRNIIRRGENYFLFFGPEGGFTAQELYNLRDSQKIKLAENRLRSETAIVKVASML